MSKRRDTPHDAEVQSLSTPERSGDVQPKRGSASSASSATAKRLLHLPLKAPYFWQINSGGKKEEYRLRTPYWGKRLDGREYDGIILTLGYPPKLDRCRRIWRPWRGVEIKTITHEHFGQQPVEVYAIKVN